MCSSLNSTLRTILVRLHVPESAGILSDGDISTVAEPEAFSSGSPQVPLGSRFAFFRLSAEQIENRE